MALVNNTTSSEVWECFFQGGFEFTFARHHKDTLAGEQFLNAIVIGSMSSVNFKCKSTQEAKLVFRFLRGDLLVFFLL